MRIKKISLLTLLVLILAIPVRSAECSVPVGVVALVEKSAATPEAINLLKKRVESALGQSNHISISSSADFFVAVSFSDFSTTNLAGPPRQVSVTADASLYLCDAVSERVIAVCALDGLKGVGNSKQKALSQALRPINATNKKCADFFNSASDKIIEYYNQQYPTLLKRGRTLAAQQKYEEAMYWFFSIPECCKGYDEAAAEGLKFYQEWVDKDGAQAYDTARAIWIAQPDAEGAKRALSVLLTIPQNSKAYTQIEALINEISETVKEDKQFETRTKYEDSTRQSELMIEAAKEVGVAWGKGQQPTTTNLNWIK